MKKILSILMVMLMSISLSAFAGTTTNTESTQKTEKVTVPTNIIIKQTIVFDDGTTIVVYYKKAGEQCKLYSTSDITKYGMSDLMRIKSTNFEKVSSVEGKCYVNKTVSALIALAKRYLK